MLSDEWFIAAPRVWASPATDIRRSWRLTTSTDDATATRNAGISAHQPAGASAAYSRRRNAIASDEPSSERKTDQSARAPATQVPGDHAETEGEQEDRHGALAQAADLGDHLGDVGVEREHAAEADGAGDQRQPRLRLGEERQLATARRLGVARARRQEGDHQDGGDHGQPGRHPERRAPADGLAEPGGDGDPEDVGHGQPDHHGRDGASLAAARGQARRDERRDAEERAVRDAAQEARGEEQSVGAGDGRERVGGGVRRHQGDEQTPPWQPRPEEREHRGTDDDPQGVRRDQVAGRAGSTRRRRRRPGAAAPWP